MAEWQTPKTNWSETDCFNVADYNRLTNNLIFLKDYASKLGNANYVEMGTNKTIESTNYAEEFNAIESNLAEINSKTYSFAIGTTQTYVGNGVLPDYKEINRIENAMQKIYTQLLHRRDNLPTLAIEHLGRPKGF